MSVNFGPGTGNHSQTSAPNRWGQVRLTRLEGCCSTIELHPHLPEIIETSENDLFSILSLFSSLDWPHLDQTSRQISMDHSAARMT